MDKPYHPDDLGEKSTEELLELREYLFNEHEKLRDANRPDSSKYLDEQLKDILSWIRNIEDELAEKDEL
jgi:hypothetical protein